MPLKSGERSSRSIRTSAARTTRCGCAAKHEQLLYGNGFTRDDLHGSLARSYERHGRARIKLKEYDQAVAAFRKARETLLKSEDPEARHEAVRINLNLAELAAAQENWA